jgi:hypothetical protein
MVLRVSLLALAAAVLFGLAGSVRRLLRSRRERAAWATDRSGDDREDRELSREQFERGAIALFRASTHHEMRQAVDAFPFLRSSLMLSAFKAALQKAPPDRRAALVYKLRWVHEQYPGPSVTICERNRRLGERHLLASILASLSGAGVPQDLLSERASEVEGSFLAADFQDVMRVAATHYPLLLLPGLQGGIDFTIEHDLAGEERAECFRRLRWLQELREEIEQQPVESWWRSIDREYPAE